jgi:hypothetical protein
MDNNNKQNPHLISYLSMRRAIGILGISLPLVLIIGSFIKSESPAFQDSISAYYHTGMRDYFVGILCATALFLFSYKGYVNEKEQYKYKDNVAGNLAAIFALLVAFCPTSDSLAGKIHIIAAGLFLLTLACFSFFLFTKGTSSTTQKRRRKRVYRSCGIIIASSVILLILYFAFLKDLLPGLQTIKPVLLLETIALIAFGTSWLIKGKFLLKDRAS